MPKLTSKRNAQRTKLLLEREAVKLAVIRDRLRALISEIEDYEELATRSHDLLVDAIDALSELV